MKLIDVPFGACDSCSHYFLVKAFDATMKLIDVLCLQMLASVRA